MPVGWVLHAQDHAHGQARHEPARMSRHQRVLAGAGCFAVDQHADQGLPRAGSCGHTYGAPGPAGSFHRSRARCHVPHPLPPRRPPPRRPGAAGSGSGPPGPPDGSGPGKSPPVPTGVHRILALVAVVQAAHRAEDTLHCPHRCRRCGVRASWTRWRLASQLLVRSA